MPTIDAKTMQTQRLPSDSPASGPIYLDHNATTQPLPEVVEAVARAERDLWANPSSVHRFGQQVRQQIELAREHVANLIGAHPAEIVFTASGTESTNLAIFGTLRRIAQNPNLRDQRNVILSTTVEHSAVAEPLDYIAKHEKTYTIERIGVDRSGLINIEQYQAALEKHKGRIALISILWANNETGVIQPLEQLAQLAKEGDPQIVFHTDAVQCVGKMPVDLRSNGALRNVDLLSFAGHKFHGPKGIGGLFVRKGVRIAPMIIGGRHERERRGGTENAPAIIGLGVAAKSSIELLAESSDSPTATSRIAQARARRDRFEQTILNTIDETSINGDQNKRLWNTTNIAFDKLEAEAILLLLSERGVCASAGAACSSGSLDPSPILLAMGIEATKAHGSIRFSIDENTTDDELDRAVVTIAQVAKRLRRALPVS